MKRICQIQIAIGAVLLVFGIGLYSYTAAAIVAGVLLLYDAYRSA